LNRSFKEMVGSKEVSMVVIMIVMSLLFSLASFLGLESHPGYFGNAYQAIHPESFPNDPSMSPGRPTMLSAYYYIVRLFGNLWLDDRVTLVLFTLLTALSLVGLDKTSQVLGAKGISERVAILSLMLLQHRIFANHAIFMDYYEFNPTTLACPAIIWLFYALLAGRRIGMIVSLMVFAILLSMKNASLPVLIALVLLWEERFGSRGKRVIGMMVLGSGFLALGGYYLLIRPADGTHPLLFDYILQYMDNAEANPFLDSLKANLIFAALCMAGFLIKGPQPHILKRVRIISGVGLVAWLVGGLYLSYSPDFMKIPFLIPFDITRALWWPQYILYIALGVFLLKRIQNASTGIRVCALWFLWMTLYFMHNTFHTKLAIVVAGVTIVMLLRWMVKKGFSLRAINPKARLQIITLAVFLGTLSLYGVGTLTHRLPALNHLMYTGIMGDNRTAQWVGVNEYIREHTPLLATVFPLSVRMDAVGGETGLHSEGSLRVRTGRSIPMITSRVAFHFDYDRLKWCDAQDQLIGKFVEAWESQDFPTVAYYLSQMGPPDYLVVPESRWEWLSSHSQFPYRVDSLINESVVLKRYLGEYDEEA
jgi:hypothetical protein